MDIGDGARREIHCFHQFLEGWMTGEIDRDEADMGKRLEAFHADFLYVPPSGRVRRLTDLRQWFVHGHRSNPGVRIAIDNVAIRLAGPGFVLAIYEEHQRSPREETRRLSSAVFLPAAAAPNGVAWFHLHEVLLPGEENANP
jgi:hypothetical protein